MTGVVPAVFPWSTNAALIADVARLGYLDGRVWDSTYGRGAWWQRWCPADLVASDLDVALSPVGCSVDVRNPPAWLGTFDCICFDPPYKLNGRPDAAYEWDLRYGIHSVAKVPERLALIGAGIEALSGRLNPGGHLLVKVQDQVNSNRQFWLTDLATEAASAAGLVKVDRFDLIGRALRQPMVGRKQKHSHGRGSTLLVFQRKPDAKTSIHARGRIWSSGRCCEDD